MLSDLKPVFSLTVERGAGWILSDLKPVFSLTMGGGGGGTGWMQWRVLTGSILRVGKFFS